ncbi:unnamed protein product [Effrenium voratum]|nr:unnamed protein product [Effrenium voratum]
MHHLFLGAAQRFTACLGDGPGPFGRGAARKCWRQGERSLSCGNFRSSGAYLLRGLYSVFLGWFAEAFDASRFLLRRAEDLDAAAWARLLHFAGLDEARSEAEGDGLRCDEALGARRTEALARSASKSPSCQRKPEARGKLRWSGPKEVTLDGDERHLGVSPGLLCSAGMLSRHEFCAAIALRPFLFASPRPRHLLVQRAATREDDVVASVMEQISQMRSPELERLVERLLPIFMGKRRLLRDRLRPKRIVLVRHGESVGNKDRSAYQWTPDNKIELTRLGRLQGEAAGEQVRKLVGNSSVRFFYSPYIRTRQTLQCILRAFEGQQIEICAEPRLREQDFGNFQNVEAMEKVYSERQKFGRFYYRFPNGEAGTDVFDRVSDFWSSLLRSMDKSPVENLVLVSHGLLMRIFCMVYFHWTVEEFEQVWNPSNCEVWALEKDELLGKGSYNLAGRWRPCPQGGRFCEIRFGARKNEPLWSHMKSRRGPRQLIPGDDRILCDPMFAHLRPVVEMPTSRRKVRVKKDVPGEP